MTTLIISDIHANLEALEAVLRAAEEFHDVLCLGDIVGYGADPLRCVARVRQLPRLTALTGNHDQAALGLVDPQTFNAAARQAVRWTAQQLDLEARNWLRQRPPALDCDEYYLAHASPRDPIWEYLEDGVQGPPNFALFSTALCFVGHTHVPREFLEQVVDGVARASRVRVLGDGERIDLGDGRRRILNPGSVGQPRDGDPRAAYALWDGAAGSIQFHRVAYDVGAAQRKIRDAGLPEIEAARLAAGR